MRNILSYIYYKLVFPTIDSLLYKIMNKNTQCCDCRFNGIYHDYTGCMNMARYVDCCSHIRNTSFEKASFELVHTTALKLCEEGQQKIREAKSHNDEIYGANLIQEARRMVGSKPIGVDMLIKQEEFI